MDVEAIAAELGAVGFVTVEDFLAPALRTRLGEVCGGGVAAGFVPAAMGRGEQRTYDAAVRGDVIQWLDHGQAPDHAFLTLMEELRVGLNQRLFLGLLEYECHYALYGVGAQYQKHLDTLGGRKNRVLSTVVYLNDGWAPADGGELVLYRSGTEQAIARILPRPGLMVLFLSDEFPHEVLPTARTRHSIAGWFRGRAGTDQVIEGRFHDGSA
jgi:SM-20-related protein